MKVSKGFLLGKIGFKNMKKKIKDVSTECFGLLRLLISSGKERFAKTTMKEMREYGKKMAKSIGNI